MECIEQVPKSVAALAPLADFVCELDNTAEKPVLLNNGLCKGGGCSFDTFPSVLGLNFNPCSTCPQGVVGEGDLTLELSKRGL